MEELQAPPLTWKNDTTDIVSIYEGYILKHSEQSLAIGGYQATKIIEKLLGDELKYSMILKEQIVDDIKSKCCFIPQGNWRDEGKIADIKDGKKEYELPDGKTIDISGEVRASPGMLLHADGYDDRCSTIGSLCGMRKCDSLFSIVESSINSCDVDDRRDLWANIVIAGGFSLTQNMDCVINHNLQSTGNKVKVIATGERKYSPWIGGSILASLSTFDQMYVRPGVYDELGVYQVLAKMLTE